MAEPVKHHFLPVFYLKNWCSSDDRLVQFSIPYEHKVKAKRVHPQGTGYIHKLYAIEGFPGEISHEIEKRFLSPVDSRASDALKALINGKLPTPQQRQSWSHFIMTLLMRMPVEIGLLKELVKKMNIEIGRSVFDMLERHTPIAAHADIHMAFDEYRSSIISRSIDQILRFMSTEEIVDRVSKMEWDLLHLGSAPYDLLTSDRPVVVDRPNGETVIALPIAPRTLFLSSTNRSLLKELKTTSPKKIVEAMNIEIVSGAHQFVYGRTDQQLVFVQNRFGRNKSPSLVAKIISDAGINVEEIAAYMSSFYDQAMRKEIELALLKRTGSSSLPL